jgi:hypothetical protein
LQFASFAVKEIKRRVHAAPDRRGVHAYGSRGATRH